MPSIGRYSEFDLKFHSCYNWLISAVLEFREKYSAAHNNKDINRKSQLDFSFERLMHVSLFYFDRYTVWTLLSDYAIQLLQLKAHETNAKHIPAARS